MPDFIGYIILTWGLVRMEDEIEYFSKIHMFTKAMATYTIFACYNWSSFWVNFVIGAISTAGSLYVSYCIVNGIREAGEKKMLALACGFFDKEMEVIIIQ